MTILFDKMKSWSRKVVCTALPPSFTMSTETELVVPLEYGDLRLDVHYQARAYRAFGMEHHDVVIYIDTGIGNIHRINNAGKEVDDVLNIPEYHFEGTYRGSSQYHISRYLTHIMKMQYLH